jgi:hypothetical protein
MAPTVALCSELAVNALPAGIDSCSQSSARRGTSGCRRLLWLVLLGAIASAGVAVQVRADSPPPPWPPELGEAFALYYAGEFLEAQRVCQQLRATTRAPDLRREAAALAALATMRLPGRANRVEGRARLAQLAQQDASFLTRPECQLAYGIAQTALHETATAIHHLNQAAERFAAAGRSGRLAETCVALAEAWARHGEWEIPTPGLDLPRPDTPEEADRLRVVQIERLRERVADLPDSAEYLARINLILARHLLERDGAAAEGLELLEQLARREPLTTTAAQACMALAEQRERQERWSDAARFYARVAAAGLGTLSRQATQRHDAIRRPRLVLDAPDQVTPGDAVVVDLCARNVTGVELEVRRVDLAEWLTARQGRFAEGALPTTGALVAVRQFDTTVKAEHGWWRSEVLDEPLGFEAPVGPMVVAARGTDVRGRSVVAKRLVIASDLPAAVFVGARRAVIWAPGPEKSPVSGAGRQARFWMHGSFVPTRPEFRGDTAVFTLPPEARLLRDKRWACLVMVGQQVTLCRGTLPPAAATRQPQPIVALAGGPPELRVGDELRTLGVLLGPSSGASEERWAPTVELELLDALERSHGELTAEVSEAGTFTAQWPISASMAGEHLHVATRLDGRVIESLYRPLKVHVAPLDEPAFRVTCELEARRQSPDASVAARIEATCPWGKPLYDGFAGVGFRAVRLPAGAGSGPTHSHVISADDQLDPAGKWSLELPVSRFGLPDGPIAVGMWAHVAGWDARQRGCSAEALVGPRPIHLWLQCETRTPRVGEPLYVSVGWFDPTGQAVGVRPTLAVWRDAALLADLDLLPTIDRLRSTAWRPLAPGDYELVATLQPNQGDPLTIREVIEVESDRTTDREVRTPLRYAARFTRRQDQPCVNARVEGRWRGPLLALVVTDDLLGAQSVSRLDGTSELVLPLTDSRGESAQLVLAAFDSQRIRVIGATGVRPADDEAFRLTISREAGALVPGGSSEIHASVTRGAQPVHDATLLARLVDRSRSGAVPWLPGEPSAELLSLPSGIGLASSGAVGDMADSSGSDSEVIAETRELSPLLARALFELPTLWVDAQSPTDGAADFAVPLPPTPGLYRLIIAARTPAGGFAYDVLDLDTRQGTQLIADVPPTLTLGDRTVAALVIKNNRPELLPVRVRLDGGPGLHVEALRLVGSEVSAERRGDGLALPLGPRGVVTLRADIEARQPGSGTAEFVVETEHSIQRATASYRVHALPETRTAVGQATGPAVKLWRALFRLQRDLAAEQERAPGEEIILDGQPEWLRIQLQPGERVTPGEPLLVQEVLALERPLTNVEWRQRLPGNCHTFASSWPDLEQIGTRRELQLQATTRGAGRLAADRDHVHEYALIPVRPGACQLPPPEVRASGATVPVQVISDVPRLIVADSD